MGADLFTRDASKYLHLVAADYYFKYQFVRQTDSQYTKQNQHRLENNETASYRKQGIPKLVRTKNGLHFNGLVFQELAQELNFENITSFPRYPHYNGFIKAKSDKSALLKSKVTKLSQTLTCCFFQQNLPRKIPRDPSNEDVGPRLTKRQQLQIYYYDRSTKPLPEITRGKKIIIQLDPSLVKWKYGGDHIIQNFFLNS